MDYPKYPKSTPFSGSEAERIKKAILAGESITNPDAERTFRRLLEVDRKRKAKANAASETALPNR